MLTSALSKSLNGFSPLSFPLTLLSWLCPSLWMVFHRYPSPWLFLLDFVQVFEWFFIAILPLDSSFLTLSKSLNGFSPLSFPLTLLSWLCPSLWMVFHRCPSPWLFFLDFVQVFEWFFTAVLPLDSSFLTLSKSLNGFSSLSFPLTLPSWLCPSLWMVFHRCPSPRLFFLDFVQVFEWFFTAILPLDSSFLTLSKSLNGFSSLSFPLTVLGLVNSFGISILGACLVYLATT